MMDHYGVDEDCDDDDDEDCQSDYCTSQKILYSQQTIAYIKKTCHNDNNL